MGQNGQLRLTISLNDRSHQETVFFLGVILANIYISNKRNSATPFETQAFSFHIKEVYEKIFHTERKWSETYMSMSAELVDMINSGRDLIDIVSGAIQHGLHGVSEKECVNIITLYDYISFFLPILIQGGNVSDLTKMASDIRQIMYSFGYIRHLY